MSGQGLFIFYSTVTLFLKKSGICYESRKAEGILCLKGTLSESLCNALNRHVVSHLAVIIFGI